MGYTSKYKGAEIDALLDKVKKGGNGGGVPIVSSETELDALNLPIGSIASVASDVDTVDVVSLYQPSTEDFSAESLPYDKLSRVMELVFEIPPLDFSPAEGSWCFIKDRNNKTIALDVSFNCLAINDGNSEEWPEYEIFEFDENGLIVGINQTSVSMANEILANGEYFYMAKEGEEISEDNFDAFSKTVKITTAAYSCRIFKKTFDNWKGISAYQIYDSVISAESAIKNEGECAVVEEITSIEIPLSELLHTAEQSFSNLLYTNAYSINPADVTASNIAIATSTNPLVEVLVIGLVPSSKSILAACEGLGDFTLATWNDNGKLTPDWQGINKMNDFFIQRNEDFICYLISGDYVILDQLFLAKHSQKNRSLFVKGKSDVLQFVDMTKLKDTVAKEVLPNYLITTLPNSGALRIEANTYSIAYLNGGNRIVYLRDNGDRKVVKEYVIEFDINQTTNITFSPSSIVWANGSLPVFEANTKVVVSICNNLAVFAVFPK